MTKKKAIENIEVAIEKLLFGMGEMFPIEYIKLLDESIKLLKEEIENDKTE